MSFVHLHNHTHYSLLDGLAKPEEYMKIARQQGSPAVAITDHGVVYGLVDFYKQAKLHDIKPILGCEFYVAPVSRFSRDQNERYYHLVLLAENNEGYQNLLRLATIASLEGFYYKPRIDLDILKEHSRGLIGLSGCLKGEVTSAALLGDDAKTVAVIKKHQAILGPENFYLEVQYHPELALQKKANEVLIRLAKDLKIPLVATNDCHYAYKEDANAHDVLVCIQTQSNLSDTNRLRYTSDFSMKSLAEMTESFKEVPEAISNTVKIAERCQVNLKFGHNLMPAFVTGFNKEPKDYLRELCEEGLKIRYGETPAPEVRTRLEYELDMIHRMGFETYFLIVHDFVNYAKNQGIVVGPGRGSAAGSIISYCLKITDIDPLKYGLLFERFLNPERVSMPDIDIDFADTRRDEVLAYVTNKYGQDKVAQIITFGTMAARAAVRDAGRVLGYPYKTVDEIAKLVPGPVQGKHVPLAVSTKSDPELSRLYKENPDAKKILDTAIRLDGTIRQAGTHACAVVISKEPLDSYTGLQRPTGAQAGIVTQYSMKPLEEIGLLKMDFLGLKNLTIIERTINITKQSQNQDIILADIPLEDKKTFALLQSGQTTGVFQLESAGMRRYLKDLKPTSFEDIIAMVSLYRPGPMEWIPDYIKGKHGLKKTRYLHPSLEPILKETYGIALYQEQILEIARVFAGFSLGEADLLRRAIGKKIPAELLAQKKKFIDGAMAKKYPESLAKDIFENVVEPFAAYGFNKSHAACYALISYQTAYLKANFPAEFMAALLTDDAGDTDRVVIEIMECEAMGISVLPPSVNQSFAQFTVVDKNHIRFGLQAIKGLGDASVEEILKARGQIPFKNLEDFIKRLPPKILNKKTVEALAYCGALDDLGERKAIVASLEDITQYAKGYHHSSQTGQSDIFDLLENDTSHNFHLKPVEPATSVEKLAWEKQYLGLYVSSHPLDGLKKYFFQKVTLSHKITKKLVGKSVKVCGLLVQSKRMMTKSGVYMLAGSLEDPTGRINVVLFPNVYEKYKDVFTEDGLMAMTGRITLRGNELQIVCQEAKTVSLERMIANAKKEGLYDPKERVSRRLIPNETAGQEIQPAQEISTEQNISEEVYVITLPTWIKADGLAKIKTLLHQYQGEGIVEIHIPAGDRLQKMRLPFGVRVDDQLKQAIVKALEKE